MNESDTQPDAIPNQLRDTSSESDSADDKSDEQSVRLALSRRTALASMVGFGGLSVASGTAEARHGGLHWRNFVSTTGDSIFGDLEVQGDLRVTGAKSFVETVQTTAGT